MSTHRDLRLLASSKSRLCEPHACSRAYAATSTTDQSSHRAHSSNQGLTGPELVDITLPQALVVKVAAQLHAACRVRRLRNRKTPGRRESAQTTCRCRPESCSPCPWLPAGT